MKHTCPDCGSDKVITRKITEEFRWGVVILKARIPFRKCEACGYEYTDDEAEDIREEAVRRWRYNESK